MKKYFIVLVVLMLAFNGCKSNVEDKGEARFQIIYVQKDDGRTGIMIDKETGVKYLIVSYINGVGITKLEE